MSTRRRAAAEAVGAGGLLAVVGALAWLTGRPLVFPSLGPSAYLLAVAPDEASARRVLGGHAVGTLAGLGAYHALAGGGVALGRRAVALARTTESRRRGVPDD